MSHYLITGASGYIGSMLAKHLIVTGEKVGALVRDPLRLDQNILSNAEVIIADVTDQEAVLGINGKYDYILHCASPTKSAYMVSRPTEVTRTIVNGTDNILALARKCEAQSVVFLSSMEIYGQIECANGRRITEDEMGYIDVASVRSCYPMAKLMAENLCCSYWKEYGIPVKIARLAQTFGRGVCLNDNRVFAQFAESVKKGTDIILHTPGDSMGNYCDIDDAVEGILFIMKYGENGQAYNVVNENNTMTIREMAELVAKKVAQNGTKVKYMPLEEMQNIYAAKTGLRLSGQKLRSLGWEAKTSLEQMYRAILDEGRRDFVSNKEYAGFTAL